MKKLLKILSILASAIPILVIAAVVGIGLFANSTLRVATDSSLKKAIETTGTEAFNVRVTVRDVDLALIAGKLDLRSLMIDNPPGYKHEKLLELSEAKITMATRSLLSEIINIEDIKLDGVNVVLEQRGISGSNLQDLLRAMRAKEKQESEPTGKRLHVDNLEITRAVVKVKLLPLPGKADTLTLKLAPIKTTHCTGEKNLDGGALSRKVLITLAKGIAEQGANTLPKEMLASLTSELKQLGVVPRVVLSESGRALESGKDIGKEAIETGKKVLGDADDVGKGITEGLQTRPSN